MNFDKVKNFKLSRTAAVILAGAVAFAGLGVMVVANPTKAEVKTASTETTLNVPGAGMGGVLGKYVGATSGSSIELLSTTAVASVLDTSYNEFYDENGETIGKLIVYYSEAPADVYDKIVGNERIERGEVPAAVIGHMYSGDVATLVRVQGDWYQIISDKVNGYVNKEGFARGLEAEKLNDSTYIHTFYANNDEVLMYADADENSTVMCVLPSGVRYQLLEEGEVFDRIYVSEVGEGWVMNTDGQTYTERRYASDVADEINTSSWIADGVALAADLEAVRANVLQASAMEELPAQQVLQSIGYIAPAAADTEDVAALRQAIADYAQQFVGILPYISASSDLTYGADCSGFTSAIYRAYGYDISRTPEGQFYGGQQVSLDDIRVGDIVYYSGHVALYVGNGMVVHESVPGTNASYADMYMMPVYGVVRYIN